MSTHSLFAFALTLGTVGCGSGGNQARCHGGLADRAYVVSKSSDEVDVIDMTCLELVGRVSTGGVADESLLAAAAGLAAAARAHRAPLIVVTNEVGGGIVPESALGRRFRDLAGLVNQRLSAASDEVYLVAAGLPLRLK